ncbi:MAG: FKBP-type peptidyl-prolyl cis-trans isomerase, partial [Methanobacteriota archaeon]
DGEFRESSYARGDTLLVSVDPANQDGTYIGVIPGFSEGLIGMKTGETNVAIVPPSKGYVDPDAPLFGYTLIFQIELVSIDTA